MEVAYTSALRLDARQERTGCAQNLTWKYRQAGVTSSVIPISPNLRSIRIGKTTAELDVQRTSPGSRKKLDTDAGEGIDHPARQADSRRGILFRLQHRQAQTLAGPGH